MCFFIPFHANRSLLILYIGPIKNNLLKNWTEGFSWWTTVFFFLYPQLALARAVRDHSPQAVSTNLIGPLECDRWMVRPVKFQDCLLLQMHSVGSLLDGHVR